MAIRYLLARTRCRPSALQCMIAQHACSGPLRATRPTQGHVSTHGVSTHRSSGNRPRRLDAGIKPARYRNPLPLLLLNRTQSLREVQPARCNPQLSSDHQCQCEAPLSTVSAPIKAWVGWVSTCEWVCSWLGHVCPCQCHAEKLMRCDLPWARSAPRRCTSTFRSEVPRRRVASFIRMKPGSLYEF
jgi:hypothetical protein